MSCVTIYGFSYKTIFSSRKIYIEIFKIENKLKYSIELDRNTLLILILEKSIENLSKIAIIKNCKIMLKFS